MLLAWLVLPIWIFVAVPMDLSFGRIEVSQFQKLMNQRPTGDENPELLAIEPGLVSEAPVTSSPTALGATGSVTLIGMLQAVGLVWLAGIGVGLIKLLVDQLALCRVLRNLQSVDDPRALQLWERATSGVPSSVRPSLHITTEIDTPFSTGWVRPKVVFPHNVLTAWSDEELIGAMSHELAHWRQRDLLSCRLQRLVQIVHWWNPIVRTLNRSFCHVQEVVCDTIAVHASSSQRTYASLLIKIAENLRGPSNIPGAAVGMARNISSLEQRIRTITSKETTMKSIEMKRRNIVFACTTACCLALPILGVQLTQANEHGDRDKEINEFHFKTKPKDKSTDDTDAVIAEIVIKRNGEVRRIRVPSEADFDDPRISDFISEMKERDHDDEVKWVEKHETIEDSIFSGDTVDELDRSTKTGMCKFSSQAKATRTIS
jgi:beta-lactamase regulating signal transducer with metallopeptidase domain